MVIISIPVIITQFKSLIFINLVVAKIQDAFRLNYTRQSACAILRKSVQIRVYGVELLIN